MLSSKLVPSSRSFLRRARKCSVPASLQCAGAGVRSSTLTQTPT